MTFLKRDLYLFQAIATRFVGGKMMIIKMEMTMMMIIIVMKEMMNRTVLKMNLSILCWPSGCLLLSLDK